MPSALNMWCSCGLPLNVFFHLFSSIAAERQNVKCVCTGAVGAFHGADTGGAHTIAIEHAVNMLLARVAFDLLRSPKFKLQIIAHIQKKLDELKVPDYINALQVSHKHLACHHAS